jgi:hypothetical protein
MGLSANLFDPLNDPPLCCHYLVSTDGPVRILIFNVAGERVRLLSSQYQANGAYTVCFDGRDDNHYLLASGVYLVVLEQSGQRELEKFLVLKH